MRAGLWMQNGATGAGRAGRIGYTIPRIAPAAAGMKSCAGILRAPMPPGTRTKREGDIVRVQKTALLEFIRKNGTVTFADIEEFFRRKKYNFRGDTAIKLSDRVIWCGWQHKAAVAFLELYRDERIDILDSENSPVPVSKVNFDCRKVVIKAR